MIQYKVAQSGADYAKAHALIRSEGVQVDYNLTLPTILGIEDGKVVGVVGTTIQDHMIVAGPTVIKGNRPRTALRLIEAYENAMRNLGITSYIFNVQQGSILEKFQRKYYGHIPPYSVSQGIEWFIRKLDGSQEKIDGRD